MGEHVRAPTQFPVHRWMVPQSSVTLLRKWPGGQHRMRHLTIWEAGPQMEQSRVREVGLERFGMAVGVRRWAAGWQLCWNLHQQVESVWHMAPGFSYKWRTAKSSIIVVSPLISSPSPPSSGPLLSIPPLHRTFPVALEKWVISRKHRKFSLLWY